MSKDGIFVVIVEINMVRLDFILCMIMVFRCLYFLKLLDILDKCIRYICVVLRVWLFLYFFWFIDCYCLIGRLLRYWLKGFKVNIWEVWMDFFGILDNVCWNEVGDFWVVFYGKCILLEMYIGVVLWFCYFVVKFFIFLE